MKAKEKITPGSLIPKLKMGNTGEGNSISEVIRNLANEVREAIEEIELKTNSFKKIGGTNYENVEDGVYFEKQFELLNLEGITGTCILELFLEDTKNSSSKIFQIIITTKDLIVNNTAVYSIELNCFGNTNGSINIMYHNNKLYFKYRYAPANLYYRYVFNAQAEILEHITQSTMDGSGEINGTYLNENGCIYPQSDTLAKYKYEINYM